VLQSLVVGAHGFERLFEFFKLWTCAGELKGRRRWPRNRWAATILDSYAPYGGAHAV